MKLEDAKQTLTEYMRLNHYAESTIEAYQNVLVKFCGYLINKTDVAKLPHAKRIEEFLTWRVVNFDISPSTQNIELNALVCFHRIMGIEVAGIDALRARRRDRIPHILSRTQVKTLISSFPADLRLIPMLLYGCGARINEILRLRIKDVDLSLEKLTIHEAKGDKDRVVPIPKSLLSLVSDQLALAISNYETDRSHNFNGVNCGGIEKKYPSYPKSKDWYWLFPAESYSTEPKTQTPMMRHHVMDYTIQRAFEAVRSRLNLPVYTTPHILRHACLTHMAEDMLRQGFPEKMIKAELKSLSGHVMDETLEIYLHLAAPKNAFVVSPIEGIMATVLDK